MWKRNLFELGREKKDFQATMKAAAEKKLPMKQAQGVLKQIMKNVHALPQILSVQDEFDTLKDAEKFLSDEYGCEVKIFLEDEGEHPKAKSALPNKPAIVIE